MSDQNIYNFRQVVKRAYVSLKQNYQNYQNQLRAYDRGQRIVVQSQVAQLISKMTRIIGKNVKNYDSLKQLEQLTDTLIKENSDLTQQMKALQQETKETKKNNIFLNPKASKQKVVFQNQENYGASLYRTQHNQNKRTKTVMQKEQTSSHYDTALHERNCSEKKPVNYSPLESLVVNDIESELYIPQANSPRFNSGEKSVKQLEANLKRAEAFIIKNNQQFTVEIQMYNEKIWQLQEKLKIQQEQILVLQAKAKQSEYLLDKLRKDNIRLEGINRNVQQYFDAQEAQQKGIKFYDPRRISKNQTKNSINYSNGDEKNRLKHFLRTNVSRSFMGSSSSISKKR